MDEHEVRVIIRGSDGSELIDRFEHDSDAIGVWGLPPRPPMREFIEFRDGIIQPEEVVADLSDLRRCSDLWELSLYGNITHVDLSPLEGFKSLVSFSVFNTRLKELDLEPLSECVSLKGIEIERTLLAKLDLSPLQKLENLEIVNLEYNHLTELDLTAMKGKEHLGYLYFNHNKLAELDLYPLSSCQHLMHLYCAYNLLEKIDVTPLMGLRYLNKIFFDSETKLIADLELKHFTPPSPVMNSLSRFIDFIPLKSEPLVIAEIRRVGTKVDGLDSKIDSLTSMLSAMSNDAAIQYRAIIDGIEMNSDLIMKLTNLVLREFYYIRNEHEKLRTDFPEQMEKIIEESNAEPNIKAKLLGAVSKWGDRILKVPNAIFLWGLLLDFLDAATK